MQKNILRCLPFMLLIWGCKNETSRTIELKKSYELDSLAQNLSKNTDNKSVFIEKKNEKYFKVASFKNTTIEDDSGFEITYNPKNNEIISCKSYNQGEDNYTVSTCFLKNDKIIGGILSDRRFGVFCDVETTDECVETIIYWLNQKKLFSVVRNDSRFCGKNNNESLKCKNSIDSVSISAFIKEVPTLISFTKNNL